MLHKTHEDHLNARALNKSTVDICNEESVPLNEVFLIFCPYSDL